MRAHIAGFYQGEFNHNGAFLHIGCVNMFGSDRGKFRPFEFVFLGDGKNTAIIDFGKNFRIRNAEG